MKSLLLLFILDFSGSMYQKLNQNEIKYQVLQQNVRAMNSALKAEDLNAQSGVLTFGLNAKKKCQDLAYSELSTGQVPAHVEGLRPGAYSKTPLAEAIRQGTEITIQHHIKKVIVFSDGADSCGQDPCQELLRANEKLKSAQYVMNMKFIGIDLKKNDSKFECFRNNKHSNINIDFSNIGESFDIQQALLQANDVKIEDVKSPNGIFRVRGAPAHVQFHILNTPKKWFGAYGVEMSGGSYTIESSHPKTKKIFFTLNPGHEKEIFWEDFFYKPFSKMNFKKSSISYLLTPGPQTLESHKDPKVQIIYGNENDFGLPTNLDLPFGDWMVEIISPVWLKKSAGVVKILIEPEKDAKIDLQKLFGLKWIENSRPDVGRVFEVIKNISKVQKAEEGEMESPRYYLQPGIDSLPIKDNFELLWIDSENENILKPVQINK